MSNHWLKFSLFVILIAFICSCYNRLPLPQRKTMAKKREKHNGLQRRGLSMVFNHLNPTTFSLKEVVTESFQRSQNKPSAVLRLQGKKLKIYWANNARPKTIIKSANLTYTLRVEIRTKIFPQ